jgi:hypothetical protein
VPAKDHLQNVDRSDLVKARDELLNKTARLPGVAMVHLQMRVRFTLTVEDSARACRGGVLQSLYRLQPPCACSICLRWWSKATTVTTMPGPGPWYRLCQSHSFCAFCACDEGQEARTVSVKAKRDQLGFVVYNALTLHNLLGATADPGLIFHWRFPGRLDKQMRWSVRRAD